MKKLLLIALVGLSIQVLAQHHTHQCGYDHYVQQLNEQYPHFYETISQSFAEAKAHGANKFSTKSIQSEFDTVYRVPVVFHVVYNTTAQNISDELLKSQIDVLNEDFRKRNADTSETRAIFKDRAADAGIEFFLATLDPDGNITNGITRTQTSTTNFGSGFFPDPTQIDNNLKKTANGGKDPWPTDKYMNIWIANIGDALLGYAYPPLIAPNWPANAAPADTSVWGVVVNYAVVGYENPLALPDADKGRTATHEIGHYLGLRHIWGDGSLSIFVPDCSADDGIDDTPNSGNNSQGSCDVNKNTCTDDPEPDMWENYMDYSKESCQNIFTEGQVAVMRSMVALGRPNLAKIILDEVITLNIGDYVVVNNTDTFVVGTDNFTVNTGDEVMFLNENNGFNYTATGSFSVNGQTDVLATKEGTVSNTTTSISGISVLQNVSIYPNPSNHTITIDGLDALNATHYSLTDLQGKTIAKMNANHKNLLVKNYPEGMYFLNIYKENTLLVSKKIAVY